MGKIVILVLKLREINDLEEPEFCKWDNMQLWLSIREEREK